MRQRLIVSYDHLCRESLSRIENDGALQVSRQIIARATDHRQDEDSVPVVDLEHSKISSVHMQFVTGEESARADDGQGHIG